MNVNGRALRSRSGAEVGAQQGAWAGRAAGEGGSAAALRTPAAGEGACTNPSRLQQPHGFSTPDICGGRITTGTLSHKEFSSPVYRGRLETALWQQAVDAPWLL